MNRLSVVIVNERIESPVTTSCVVSVNVEMRKILFSFTFIVLLLPLVFTNVNAAPVSETLMLHPIADATVDSALPTTNNGENAILRVDFWDRTIDQHRNVYLMFNLSILPSDANIVSASMEIFNSLVILAFIPTINVYQCSNTTWKESLITWNNAPSFDSTTSDAQMIQSANLWYSWNVTTPVRSSLSNGLLSLVMQINNTGGISESYTTQFNSKEALLYQPRLVMTYTTDKIPSQITCTLSQSNVTLGDDLTISGTLTSATQDPLVDQLVNVTLIRPDNSTAIRWLMTASAGEFTHTFIPNATGLWQVQACWDGDLYYHEATSPIQSVTVNQTGTFDVWVFIEKSAYTEYTVTVIANSTWEVGTEQLVTMRINVTGTESWRGGYLHVQTVILGIMLHTRNASVNQVLQVGESYTHTMAFYVTEAEYDIYDSDAFEKILTYAIVGRSHYSLDTGSLESTILYQFNSWPITIRGVIPVASVHLAHTNVKQGAPFVVTVTYHYPSDRPIEGCTVTIVIDLQTFTSTYQGDGVYTVTIDTITMSGTKEFEINVEKSRYFSYRYHPRSGSKYQIFVESNPRCIIATATYGSDFSPEVQFLRGFRDHEVHATFAGTQFMAVFNCIYYSFSPAVASVIAANSVLRNLMKGGLMPLLAILHIASATYGMFNLLPELAIVAAGVIASAIIGIVYLTPVVMILWRILRVRKYELALRKWLITLMLSSGMLIAIAELSVSSALMQASTASLVLSTAIFAALSLTATIERKLRS